MWRAVESQYEFSTRKIVDTSDEQVLLEEWLEDSKPLYMPGTEQLHYLLKTPFRYYPANPYGSRFRRVGDKNGVFYGSEQTRTALAEYAYYRLRFFSASPGTRFPSNPEKLTLFKVGYRTTKGIDLMLEPYKRKRKQWVDPVNYEKTQALAEQARDANVTVIRYESVRDIDKSANIALLDPNSFVSNNPKTLQTWFIYISDKEINCNRARPRKEEDSWTFRRSRFGL